MTSDGYPDPADTRSMTERMLAGDLYRADDPVVLEALLDAADLMDAYNRTTSRQQALRDALLARMFAAIGEHTYLRPPLYIDYGSNIRMGSRVFANYGLTALDVAPITIGDDVLFGPHVQLLTPTHPLEPDPRREKWEAAKPITIGNNVWLGGGVIVLPGVTIGENTVVGSGAVVTKDLPSNVVAVGNPAKVIRTLDGAADRERAVAEQG